MSVDAAKPYRITGKGIGFLVAAIVVYLLASLTQVGWLYLVDSVLWGIIILAALFPWRGVAFVKAQRTVQQPQSTRDSPGPAEGDAVKVSLTLRCRAFWPSYVLNLFYHCPLAAPENSLQRYFVSNISASGQVSIESTVEVYQRGLHHLGPVIAESTAPFGLFRRQRQLTAGQDILVYPQVYTLRRLALAEGMDGLEARPRKSRTGADLAGSRKYVPGDHRRIIHWRNTARAGQLMVKELEDPVDETVYLVFDATHVFGEGRETTLEYGIKVLASVADYAYRNHVPVRVVGGRCGTAGVSQYWNNSTRSRRAWRRLLGELALAAPEEGLNLIESLIHLPPGASALVAASPSDHPAMQAIARLSSTLRRLVVVSLEGFGDPEAEDRGLNLLRGVKAPVVNCRQGRLREALNILESMDGLFLSSRSVASATFVP